MDVLVDLVGGDAGAHDLAGEAQDLGGDGARPAHPGDDLRRLDARLVPRDRDAGVGVRRPADVVGHGAHRRHDAGQDPALRPLVAALVLASAPAPARVVGLRQRRGGVGERAHGIQDTWSTGSSRSLSLSRSRCTQDGHGGSASTGSAGMDMLAGPLRVMPDRRLEDVVGASILEVDGHEQVRLGDRVAAAWRAVGRRGRVVAVLGGAACVAWRWCGWTTRHRRWRPG